MGRRKVLADANQALGIRRLQEQAALSRLHLQKRAAADAKADLERLVEAHALSEGEWTSALARASIDIGQIGLWRLDADRARGRVVEGERTVALEDESVETYRQAWAMQLSLADAADGVARAAARDARRAEDERRLQSAEDILRARRRGQA